MFENALVVTDQNVNVVYHGKPGALTRRYRQTAETHGHEESYGLQRDGLPSRVRPADHQGGRGVIERDGSRHHVLVAFGLAERLDPRGGQALVDERMPSVQNAQLPIIAEGRSDRLAAIEEKSAGLGGIESAGDVRRVEDVSGYGRDLLGDEAGDPGDFFSFLLEQIGEIIVQLNHSERLDEEGCTRSGAFVKNPGNGIAVIAADRDAVAVAADGNERLLNGIGMPAHEVREILLDGLSLGVRAGTDRAQLGRGLFAQFAVDGKVARGV